MSEPITTPGSADDRVRMIIDTDELIRQAIALRTVKEGRRLRRHVSKSEVATMILRAGLAEEIAELEGWEDPSEPQNKAKGKK